MGEAIIDRGPQPSVSELMGKQVEQILHKRIAGDALSPPTLPVVADRIFVVLREPGFVVRSYAAVLAVDPTLAARALRQATSGGFAGSSKKLSLEEVVSRLGSVSMRRLFSEATTLQMTPSRDGAIRDAVQGLWTHAVTVARMARDLAAFTTVGDSEAAYLAGLLHDLGKPLVAAVLLDAERQLSRTSKRPWISATDWVAVVSGVHRTAGAALAERWALPEGIVRSVRDPSEYDNSDRGGLGNLVTLANALAKKSGMTVGAVDQQDVSAVLMIGKSLVGVSDDILDKVVAGVRSQPPAL